MSWTITVEYKVGLYITLGSTSNFEINIWIQIKEFLSTMAFREFKN